jgi:hypothetical protein
MTMHGGFAMVHEWRATTWFHVGSMGRATRAVFKPLSEVPCDVVETGGMEVLDGLTNVAGALFGIRVWGAMGRGLGGLWAAIRPFRAAGGVGAVVFPWGRTLAVGLRAAGVWRWGTLIGLAPFGAGAGAFGAWFWVLWAAGFRWATFWWASLLAAALGWRGVAAFFLGAEAGGEEAEGEVG